MSVARSDYLVSVVCVENINIWNRHVHSSYVGPPAAHPTPGGQTAAICCVTQSDRDLGKPCGMGQELLFSHLSRAFLRQRMGSSPHLRLGGWLAKIYLTVLRHTSPASRKGQLLTPRPALAGSSLLFSPLSWFEALQGQYPYRCMAQICLRMSLPSGGYSPLDPLWHAGWAHTLPRLLPSNDWAQWRPGGWQASSSNVELCSWVVLL